MCNVSGYTYFLLKNRPGSLGCSVCCGGVPISPSQTPPEQQQPAANHPVAVCWQTNYHWCPSILEQELLQLPGAQIPHFKAQRLLAGGCPRAFFFALTPILLPFGPGFHPDSRPFPRAGSYPTPGYIPRQLVLYLTR